jgi:hypothetical protein
MTYLITESQKDKLIFTYLDNQDFKVIESEKRIFFVNSEGDEFAQIVIDKEDGFCEINYNLIHELTSFFPFSIIKCRDYVSSWVSDKEGVSISDSWSAPGYVRSNLKVKKK